MHLLSASEINSFTTLLFMKCRELIDHFDIATHDESLFGMDTLNLLGHMYPNKPDIYGLVGQLMGCWFPNRKPFIVAATLVDELPKITPIDSMFKYSTSP